MSIHSMLSAAALACFLLMAGCTSVNEAGKTAPAKAEKAEKAEKPAKKGIFSFRVKTDKPAVSYKIGEPVVFTVELCEDGEPAEAGKLISWERRGDDGVVEKGEAKSGAPVKVVTKGTKPGFIRLSVKAADADGSALKNGSRAVTVTSGAAVEPGRLPVAPSRRISTRSGSGRRSGSGPFR